MSSARRELLFFSPLLAMPSQHGGCVYPHALLTQLHRLGWAIDYGWIAAPLKKGRYVMRNPLSAPYVRRAYMMGATCVGGFVVPSVALRPSKRRLPVGNWFAKHGGEHLATEDEKAFARQVIRKVRPNRVLIDSTPMLSLLDGLSREERDRFQVAVLTHNLTYRRAELYQQFGQPLDFLPLTRDEEAGLLSRADVIVGIQERESEAFRAMVPDRKVVTVPMPFVSQPLSGELAVAGRCLFVGGYSGHNIEAARWLLNHVWPLVHRKVPTATLVIAGTVCRAIPNAPAGVTLRGPVDKLVDEYAATSVCLVPLPLGTGLKIKLVEAMSYGRPIVTTPAGAEGFEQVEQGKAAIVAEEPEAYSAAVAELLQKPELRQQVVERQNRWIAQSLAPEKALAPLLD